MCDNGGMSEQPPEQPSAALVAAELSRCRQRGLADLDLSTRNQEPVVAGRTEHLAQDYLTSKGLVRYGRIAQIRRLLQDGLAAYAERGNEEESRFISRLFFDPSGVNPPRRPGILLTEAERESGLADDQLAEYRRNAFARFAAFLVDFVAETTLEDAQHEGEGAETTSGAPVNGHAQKSPLLLMAIGIAGLVVAASAVTVELITNSHGTPSQPTVSPSRQSTSSPPYISGKTYTEETGEFGSPTFTDPHNPAVTGVRVKPYEKVKISCKVLAPTIPSISPDGYWYRIASPPWNNKYYSAANTYLNGDKIGAPALHNTDFKVPDCPS